MAAGFKSPKIRKSTRRRLAKEKLENEKKLENKSEEEIEIIINHELALEDSHPRGEKPKYFGELTEMDGSSHLWFGSKKACLHLAADKANEYLINIFVPKFNSKFALDYKKFQTVYETSPSAEKINYTLAVLSPRKIDNGNSLKFKNQYYQPLSHPWKLASFLKQLEKAHTQRIYA